MLRAFPLILISVVIYNAMVFAGAAAGHDSLSLLSENFKIHLFSGDDWKVTVGNVYVASSLFFLFVETVKATRTTRREIINHALSMLTFAGTLVEFITLKGFGTSTFFFITAMCLFDTVAGYTISIVAAKRDVQVVPAGQEID